MNILSEALISLCLLAGSLFVLIGAIGLYRLPDFYTRLHAPTKASTLGVGCLVLGSVLYFSLSRGEPSLHALLLTLFLFITAPVSAHMLAKAAMQQKLKYDARTRGKPWQQ